MTTKIRHHAVAATGSAYAVGHFSLKLNFPFKRFVELEEKFYLILAFEPFSKETEKEKDKDVRKLEDISISSFTELSTSDWMRKIGSKSHFDEIPFRISLPFKADKGGKGYAECDILCWTFNLDFTEGRLATLVYTKKDAPDIGIPVFQDVQMASLPTWNLRVREKETKLADEENCRPARTILSPSAWQPEVKFDGVADIHLWRLPEVLPLVDGHLHIQSNHCAPLPMVWEKMPVIGGIFKFLRVGWDNKKPEKSELTKGAIVGVVGAAIIAFPSAVFALGGMIALQITLGRWKLGLDQLSGVLFGESGKIGGKSTEKIGNILAGVLLDSKKWKLPFFSSKGPTTMATPLPMDMHYGHFHGYHGKPIYIKEGERFTFLLNPFKEHRGKISVADTKAYESYNAQMEKSESVAIDNAWTLLPLYHYDPRRWMASSETPETWDKPFDYVNSKNKRAKKSTPFVGMKTYTSLGYMPLDPALPHQEFFYDKCAQDGIPIMNHCTTVGMYTHDKPFYYDLWKKDPVLKHKHILDQEIENLEKEYRDYIDNYDFGNPDYEGSLLEGTLLLKKIAWFDRHYVFPSAWERVVANRKNLKLCLAHFCGFDFFGIKDKKCRNGMVDEKTGMIYGFPKTEQGQFPDPSKTNQLVYELCKLVRKDNQVHFDVSFFFITEYNREAVTNFFNWARTYEEGFILDRMLWGSDWPLLATSLSEGKDLKTDQLKGYVDRNAREWMALDPELWFRMAVVNTVRFYNLKEIRPHLEGIFNLPAPEAFQNPALSMAEIYANRNKVCG